MFSHQTLNKAKRGKNLDVYEGYVGMVEDIHWIVSLNFAETRHTIGEKNIYIIWYVNII